MPGLVRNCTMWCVLGECSICDTCLGGSVRDRYHDDWMVFSKLSEYLIDVGNGAINIFLSREQQGINTYCHAMMVYSM